MSFIEVGTLKTAFQTEDHGNWLFCDGRWFDKSQYPALFTYLQENGLIPYNDTGFPIPDMRGRYMMCVDRGKGLDGDRGSRSAMFNGAVKTGDNVGTIQGHAIQNITGHFPTTVPHSFQQDTIGVFYPISGLQNGGSGVENYKYGIGFNASRVVPTGANNRPNNIAVGVFIYAGEE